MRITLEDVQKLQRLIESSRNTEKECQKFLPLASPHLSRTSEKIIKVQREGRTDRGDWDVAVTVERDRGVHKTRTSYIWEAKSPQKKIFKLHRANKLVPTFDLVEAETQLLYYVKTCSGLASGFRSDMLLSAADRVLPGGIIMSRSYDFVEWGNADVGEEEKKFLSAEAYELRESFLYERAGVRLAFWDELLNWLRGAVARPNTGS